MRRKLGDKSRNRKFSNLFKYGLNDIRRNASTRRPDLLPVPVQGDLYALF